jgi:hypothetical protein
MSTFRLIKFGVGLWVSRSGDSSLLGSHHVEVVGVGLSV